MTMPTNRVFSGVQPTGNLHLGNYLGAIRHFVGLQKTHECLYCVVDMHAITVWQDPKELAHNTREVAAAYIAAGINPKEHIIFNQSKASAHAELAWVLNCVGRMGWLNRMTQFKEKAGKHKENASVGLFTYPVLMAADILVYRATHVPVGDDQKQHLELTRDIAQKFNNDFSVNGSEGFFPAPEPLIMGAATRVMSLRDGSKKMSKSDPSAMSRITLTDTVDEISKKIKKAKTDMEPIPETAEGLKERPEADNLVGIFAALSGQTKDAVLADFAGQGFGAFKPKLAELAIEKLSPITGEMARLMDDPAEIDRLLVDGAERASALAQPVLAEVKKIVGFI